MKRLKSPDSLESLCAKLKALRGKHDQTIRCEIIALLFPATDGLNETNRFLEYMIEQVEQELLHERSTIKMIDDQIAKHRQQLINLWPKEHQPQQTQNEE